LELFEVSGLQRPAPAHGARGLKAQAETMLEKYLQMFGKLRTETNRGATGMMIGLRTASPFVASAIGRLMKA